MKTILLVEDSKPQRLVTKTMLENQGGYEVLEAVDGVQALEMAEANAELDLVILDIEMPNMGGLETLEHLQSRYADLPVIMLTGSDDVKDAVTAMKLGAVDFLTKPVNAERLHVSVGNVLRLSSMSSEMVRLKRKDSGLTTFDDLIGAHGGLKQAITVGRKAAKSQIPVLVCGETGVGKELFARALHGESTRVGKPFIAINCAAIPEQLIESTLFGHEKGAFTGAANKVLGKFRQAEGGTIFLDEIGELALDVQAKLLRALQEKEVEPVGSAKPVKVDVRIVSATNRDLKKEVEEGRFREDLYFRLNVLPLEIPALCKRKEDIPALAQYFIDNFIITIQDTQKTISKDALEALKTYDWPGNVRELENMMHRLVVLSDVGEISKADVESFLSLIKAGVIVEEAGDAQGGYGSTSLFAEGTTLKTMADLEEEAMQFALEHCENNTTKAAAALGIAKSTFYRKMAQAGEEQA